jgi:hypothetical protein
MIILSAHKRNTRRVAIHLTLDGTTKDSSQPQKKMISTDYNSIPAIRIELSVESHHEFGWADFPLFEPSHDYSNPYSQIEMEQTYSLKAKAQSSSTTRTKRTRRVNFASVQIREHAITVGDHDWCEGSLPITLDWKHAKTKSMSIDDHEWMRDRQGRTPRGRLHKLEYWQRKQLLRRVSGITEQHLANMEKQKKVESMYVKLKRSKTVTIFPTNTETSQRP